MLRYYHSTKIFFKCFSLQESQQRQVRSFTGRLKRNQNKTYIQKSKEKVAFDDELYYDRDFDFQKQKQIKSIKKLFKEDYQKLIGNKKVKISNALYDRDEDDIKLYKHHNLSSQKFKKKKGDTFEKNPDEKSLNEQGPHIKRKRDPVPLPYDINEENRFDILNEILMPLHKMPYAEQLKTKLNRNKDILRFFGSKLRQLNSVKIVGHRDLPCPLELVRASPLTERYRNKDEFSVWPGIDGNPKTVGFFVGQPSIHDRVICVEPDHIIITKQSHLDFAKKFQTYLREVSPYDICQNYGLGGNWRRIHIRSNKNNQHMITAIMHPQDLSQAQLQEEMERLKDYFSNDPLISSLYFHASRHTRSTHTGEPYYHLAGDQTITEHLFNKQFVISPSSFFQINTSAAEVLYRVIMTEMNVKNNTTVLDLCCGTGILSILLSSQVRRIIAIDSSESAIEDAKKNAKLNQVNNIEFMLGNVEQLLPKMVSETYLKEPVVAVVNPSRRGLHPHVVRMLKQMSFIKKLIYVSCKPEGDSLRNFVELCFSNQFEAPFVPVNAVPVDLFPHTTHCELVLTFERFK